MKVRHKVDYSVTFEEAPGWMVGRDERGNMHIIPAENYEPIPEERWEDVTGECKVWPEGETYPFGIRHNGKLVNHCGHELNDRYRLRKVSLQDGYDMNERRVSS